MNGFTEVPFKDWFGNIKLNRELKAINIDSPHFRSAGIIFDKSKDEPVTIDILSMYKYKALMKLVSNLLDHDDEYVWLEGINPLLDNIELLQDQDDVIYLITLPDEVLDEELRTFLAKKNYGLKLKIFMDNQRPELANDLSVFIDVIIQGEFLNSKLAGGAITAKFTEDSEAIRILPVTGEESGRLLELVKDCFNKSREDVSILEYVLGYVINESIPNFIRDDMLGFIKGASITESDIADVKTYLLNVGLDVFGVKMILTSAIPQSSILSIYAEEES